MSSGKTEHYQLHVWASGDNFLRAEFNDNSYSIDEALAANATAIKEAVNAVAIAKTENENAIAKAVAAGPKVYHGTYTGNGTTSRTFNFTFKPKMLIITGNSGLVDFLILINGQTNGIMPDASSDRYYTLFWMETSVTISGHNVGICNASGRNYQYVAIG